MDLVVFEEGGLNRPEVEKPCSLKSTKSFDFVLMSYLPPSYVLKEDEEIVKYPYLLLHEEMRIVVFKGGGGSELRNQIHYEC